MKYSYIFGPILFIGFIFWLTVFVGINYIPKPTEHIILNDSLNSFSQRMNIKWSYNDCQYYDYNVVCSGLLNDKPVKFSCDKNYCEWIF